jgi:hypothetical protein
MQYSQIYDGSQYGINIDNNDISFKLRCIPQIDKAYSDHFTNWNGTKIGMDWIFHKSNTLAINNINQLIPDLNLKSLFTSTIVSPPKLSAPKLSITKLAPPTLAPPTLSPPTLSPPTLSPPTLSPPKLATPILEVQGTNFTEDLQNLINNSVTNIVQPVEYGSYPRLIKLNDRNCRATAVDYSEKSIALFARMDFLDEFCLENYGNGSGKDFIQKELGGLFNWKLKSDPTGTRQSPGYIFTKSPPFEPYNKNDKQKMEEYNRRLENYNAMKDFLIKLFGEDVFSKATKPSVTEKKSWGNNSKKEYNATPGEFFTNGPSLTNVNIPMIDGPLPSSIPSGNVLSSNFEQKKTPADLLNELTNMLILPLITVQKKDLPDSSGWEKVGIYGPKNDTKVEIDKWSTEGRDRGFEINEVISITKNGNNITILMRVPMN